MNINNIPQKKKILLLHGWDWRKYPKFNPRHQWQNRQQFLDLLEDEYDVDRPTIPGFSGMLETNNAPQEPEWNLSDYARWLRKRIDKHRYDAVIGYSFGSAVIMKYLSENLRQNSKSEMASTAVNIPDSFVLISPAILRAYRRCAVTKSIVGTVRGKVSIICRRLIKIFGNKTFNLLRHMYMQYWVQNKLYSEGTPFLRNTYLSIVKENLSPDLRDVIKADVGRYKLTLVFGVHDTETPPEILFSQVPEARHIALLIGDGDHNIGDTHPQQLMNIIKQQIN